MLRFLLNGIEKELFPFNKWLNSFRDHSSKWSWPLMPFYQLAFNKARFLLSGSKILTKELYCKKKRLPVGSLFKELELLIS